jgi:hypothetical protein
MASAKSAYNREYYRRNKSHIFEITRAIVDCECGSKVQKQKIIRHMKSKKHLLWQCGQGSGENNGLDIVAKISLLVRQLPSEHKALIKKLMECEHIETKTQIL